MPVPLPTNNNGGYLMASLAPQHYSGQLLNDATNPLVDLVEYISNEEAILAGAIIGTYYKAGRDGEAHLDGAPRGAIMVVYQPTA